MRGIHLWFHESVSSSQTTFHNNDSNSIQLGGLFLDSSLIFPDSSSLSLISCKTNFNLLALSGSLDSSSSSSHHCCYSSSSILSPKGDLKKKKRCVGLFGDDGDGFLSVSLSVNKNGFIHDGENEEIEVVKEEEKKVESYGNGAMNTTKHLWSGAVSAMVSRTIVAPLERLKLEYIVLGEQRNLFDLISTIATNQGLKGFWKGNFVNILRTAPFKAIHFYAYDTYRKQLLKMTGNEETTNFERFLAGAASGITATLLCLPMDTIRTKMVAPGGEALGGVIGAFSHMIQTEGFFSLYKGLVPSIISMAPAGAVFYGVYDILKSAHLHSPEGRKRLHQMTEHGQDANAFDQMELGPMRTLLYGAIAGACAEAATYPFEVVRRQLQMQDQARKLSALATCSMIVKQRGMPALYAGLVPSLLQVLPSAAISYFVYEFMKIVLKVE